MSFDFSQEQEQSTMNYGPVPSGSQVIVKSELRTPSQQYADPQNHLISVTSNGLRMLNFKFEVVDGTYKGVSFFQNVTLPMGYQQGTLTGGQETAASIGGATLKAMLQATNKNLNIKSLKEFDALQFPCELKISNRPSKGKDGVTEYWNNELFKVFTPDMEEYNKIKQAREVINANGAVVGNAKQGQQSQQTNANYGDFPQNASEMSDVPF